MHPRAIGCVATVTAYAPLLSMGVANVAGPLDETVKSSPPLLRRTMCVWGINPVTVTPTVNVPDEAAAHATSTFVTFAVAVPLPFVTVQVSAGLAGSVSTVTLYAPPLFTGVVNVNAPFALTGKLFPPLSCNTSPDPLSPLTLPPIVYVTVVVVHATATFVTFALVVPLPFVTAHVCAGLDGWVSTVTLYAAPLFTGVENVNAPFAVTDKLFPPLSWSTSPDPASPLTLPPIV
jgi:hypothetical protein